jgi:hypothetical protein
MRRRHALLAALPGAAPAAGERVLRYARQGDPERDFFYLLLRTLLAQDAQDWRLQPSPERLSHARALLEVQRGQGQVDVVWTMTSAEREQKLRPVRIPIDRGLFGWRVLLVREGESARFAEVRSAEDLRPFRFLQGHDWPDTQILEANGLKVERSTNFDTLFPMLSKGRADALPRAAVEVAHELRHYGPANRLELEPRLVLRYPTALYYFVPPNRPDLASLIERGLRRMFASGQWDRMLQDFYGDDLRLAKLAQRRVIELKNPLLPKETPLAEAGLWFSAR